MKPGDLDDQTVAMVIVGLIFAAALAIAMFVVFARRKPQRRPPRVSELPVDVADPAPAPFETPPSPVTLTTFEERSEISGLGGMSIVAMVIVDLAGLFVIFGGRTYVEANVFGQLANMLDRTNGLLVVLAINQILAIGILLGRTRTLVMKNPG